MGEKNTFKCKEAVNKSILKSREAPECPPSQLCGTRTVLNKLG